MPSRIVWRHSSEAATEFSERQKANIILKWRDELPRLGNERRAVENRLSALLEGRDDWKDRPINLERRSSQVKRLSVRSITPLSHTLAEASTRPQHRKSWGAASIDSTPPFHKYWYFGSRSLSPQTLTLVPKNSTAHQVEDRSSAARRKELGAVLDRLVKGGLNVGASA